MPARPHRTVDRTVGILETVSLSPRGVTLAELAAALDAAKSSVQELTNGLLARGYLVEEERRFHLGPGPFILASRANKLAALSLDHEFVTELRKLLGCNILVGVRVGDAIVFTDHAGEQSPGLTFVARTPPVARSTRTLPERLCSLTSKANRTISLFPRRLPTTSRLRSLQS
jgi:DNA-binding IclR family transcriptional regulator